MDGAFLLYKGEAIFVLTLLIRHTFQRNHVTVFVIYTASYYIHNCFASLAKNQKIYLQRTRCHGGNKILNRPQLTNNYEIFRDILIIKSADDLTPAASKHLYLISNQKIVSKSTLNGITLRRGFENALSFLKSSCLLHLNIHYLPQK